jgi:hypothetical protein
VGLWADRQIDASLLEVVEAAAALLWVRCFAKEVGHGFGCRLLLCCP